MYNGVEFVAREERNGDWTLEVRIHGIVVGHIRKQAEAFCYYRKTWSDNAPFHEERQLELLLHRVARRP